jgi:DNA invertase Pin-like site-specific DNA recombinase
VSAANGNGRLRAAAYYRMSTSRQEDSPERQRSQVRPYCKGKGYALVREYSDEGIAGDVFERRAGFQQLLRDAKAGLFSVIVADEWSRLSRQDPLDFAAAVAKPLRDARVTLDTVSGGPQKWDDLGSQLLMLVKSDKATGEAKELSRRTLAGMARLAAGEGRVFGPAPYGYKTEYETVEEPGKPPRVKPLRLVPDPDTAHVVSWVFARYAEGGVTVDWLCRQLKARGAPPPSRKGGRRRADGVREPRWNRSAVLTILRNPKYTGATAWNRRSKGKYHALPADRVVCARGRAGDARNAPGAWVVVAGTHEPLVTQATFDAVGRRLADHARGGRKHNLGAYLFSGLAVCGDCGRTLCGTTQKGVRVYRCVARDAAGETVCRSVRVREDVLLARLLAALKETFTDPARQEKLLARAREKAAADRRPESLEPLRKRLAALGAKIARGNENLLLLPPEKVSDLYPVVKGWEEERGRLAGELADRERRAPVADLRETFKGIQAWLWGLEELAGRAEDPGVLPQLRDAVKAGVCRVEVRWSHRPSKTGRSTRHAPAGGTLYLYDARGQERGLHCAFPGSPGRSAPRRG